MKYEKIKDNIIITIPFWSKRQNPWMEGEDVGSHKTLIGIIDKDEFGNEELGWAKIIDMDYKDKEDQITDTMIHYWDGDKKSFIELCKKLEIEVYEYPTCGTCGKSIYGSFGIDNNGKNICFDCEKKSEKNKDKL